MRQPGKMRGPLLVEPVEEGEATNSLHRRCPRHWQDQDIRQAVQLGPIHPRIPGVSKVATKNEGIGPRMDLKWNCRRELFHDGIH